MKIIKIAGVPEHFNLPWHLAIENKEFESQNIDLQWTDVPEGTGKMCQMLRNGETDIAVILSEGIVKDILGGNPSKIVQVYNENGFADGYIDFTVRIYKNPNREFRVFINGVKSHAKNRKYLINRYDIFTDQ